MTPNPAEKSVNVKSKSESSVTSIRTILTSDDRPIHDKVQQSNLVADLETGINSSTLNSNHSLVNWIKDCHTQSQLTTKLIDGNTDNKECNRFKSVKTCQTQTQPKKKQQSIDMYVRKQDRLKAENCLRHINHDMTKVDNRTEFEVVFNKIRIKGDKR